MNKTLSALISNRGKYYHQAAELKKDFLKALTRNDPDVFDRFTVFFDELSGQILLLNETSEDVGFMCTYTILEIIGTMISMNISEKDINNHMIQYYYELDNVKSNSGKLAALKTACLKLIEFTREVKSAKKYSKVITLSMEYIENHLNDKLFLKDLCREINYSTSHLSHQFYKETGITYGEYVRLRKMEKASMMLQKDMSIDDVAISLSYSSTSHFINAFKKTYNITPKQFVKWVELNGSFVN